ncbi:MAG: SH3 domain-containing protein [Treponema sp.]|jgi:hypothetical protein|nr:SH3 domain-containing protein [Treponema sp.]
MYFRQIGRIFHPVLLVICVLACASCSRLGWGVLLWSTEDPPIPSGTVLPVYIRSNIDHVWVVGIPEEYRTSRDINKIEIPLPLFELVGNKSKAKKQAEAFAQYAPTYAENLQDGLPIRDNPDNSARRVYRLRSGEIIKILAKVEGHPAISTTGDPLPGDWYRVLTGDGNTGYCFSYRLKFFEHYGGPLAAAETGESKVSDTDLDTLMAKTWSPESYGAMVNNRRIDLEELSKHWRFDPGQDTGMAQIHLPNLDRSFSYTGIRSTGTRSWQFEGSDLQMNLRSDTVLAVQFTEEGGAPRTLLFVSLPAEVDDLIVQETARREGLFNSIYAQGPAFTSNNYGTISFTETGEFTWTGFDLLIPQIIPPSAAGKGTIAMNLFLAPALQDRYNGAFSLRLGRAAGETEAGKSAEADTNIHFMYTLDNQGFRIEYVPKANIEDVTVMRRAGSPMVLYFFRDEWNVQ